MKANYRDVSQDVLNVLLDYGMLSKVREGCKGGERLLEKITSIVCLEVSGLKDIFH